MFSETNIIFVVFDQISFLFYNS